MDRRWTPPERGGCCRRISRGLGEGRDRLTNSEGHEKEEAHQEPDGRAYADEPRPT